jgi:hypothetical protein
LVIGAMIDEVDENWRDREDSLEFAVLDVVEALARNEIAILCMRRRSNDDQICEDWSSVGGAVTSI